MEIDNLIFDDRYTVESTNELTINNQELQNWCDARETDILIGHAIWLLATTRDRENAAELADKIWNDGDDRILQLIQLYDEFLYDLNEIQTENVDINYCCGGGGYRLTKNGDLIAY